MMESRGKESTGIGVMVGQNGEVYKKALEASEFIKDPKYLKLSIDADTVIGHTRLATVGKVSDNNAHPFVKGSIMGAHNGSVSNYLDINYKADVDSEVIFGQLDKFDNDFKKAFSTLSGKFAITWLDIRKPDQFYIGVDGNPLFWMQSKDLDTLFWCSYLEPLIMVRSIILGSSSKQDVIYEPDDERAYQFSGDLTYDSKEISFLKETAIAPKLFKNFADSLLKTNKCASCDGYLASSDAHYLRKTGNREAFCCKCGNKLSFKFKGGYLHVPAAIHR